MIRIAISAEVFEAIARMLRLGTWATRGRPTEEGERLIVMVGVGLGYIVTDAI